VGAGQRANEAWGRNAPSLVVNLVAVSRGVDNVEAELDAVLSDD
jgi:hypothetical protein